MDKNLIRALTVHGVTGLFLLGPGCDRTPADHSTGSMTVRGCNIRYSVDQAASDDGAGTISFGRHQVLIREGRILLDGSEVGKMTAPARQIAVVIANATLTITADGASGLKVPIPQ